MGVYSSAHCVPMAAKVDAAKKFMWINVCVASAVLKDKNLHYVFRPQVHSDQFGEASCSFIAENAKAKLGKELKDLKVAIIHEDGPYGVGVAMGNEAKCKELGMQVVHKEGYSATAADLSALVTKLRRAQPDVILHTGYNPDITLFLRQAKEAGLKFTALIGHGAGYGQIDKLMRDLQGRRQLLLQRRSGRGAAARSQDAQARASATSPPRWSSATRPRPARSEVPPHVSMGFNQAWIFLTDVLPRAIKKYGGFDPEALRKAALETDIPERRHHPGLRREVLPAGPQDGRAERALLAGRDAVRRRARPRSPGRRRSRPPTRCCRCRRATPTRAERERHRGARLRLPDDVCQHTRGLPWRSSTSPA